jgi:tetratricopeptide (TPR) repeat protein
MPDKASVIKEVQKYLAKGQIDKAIATWVKLTKQYPDGNTYNALGDLYLKNSDKKNALNSFR